MSELVCQICQDGYLTLLFQGDVFLIAQVVKGCGLRFIDMPSRRGRILSDVDLGLFSRHDCVR